MYLWYGMVYTRARATLQPRRSIQERERALLLGFAILAIFYDDFTIFPRFVQDFTDLSQRGSSPGMASHKNRGTGNNFDIDVERCSHRDKPSGSSTRSRAAGSVAGKHAREAPAGGQSARSRKPSVKRLASCGSPVSSGERGLIAAASALLVLVVRKD